MIKFLIFLILTFTSFNQEISLSETSKLSYKGQFGIDYWAFSKSIDNPKKVDATTNLKGQLTLNFQFAAPIEIKINTRFLYDPDNSDRNRFEFNDAYIDYFSDSFELRAGIQTFSWKTVESVSVADFLNQTDLEGNLLDADKFGELALRTRIILSNESQQVFESYYLPYFRTSTYPIGKNRYSFGLNVNNNSETFSYSDSKKRDYAQFALRYSQLLFQNIDFAVFYFNGYNRFPGILTQDFISFTQDYRIVNKFGLTFQGNLNNLLIKGEFVNTIYRDSVFNQLGKKILPNYLAFTLGFEYTLNSPFIENEDLGLILEYIGDSDSKKQNNELEGFRPFRNHLFTGFRYAFNNESDRSILIGSIIDLKEHNLIYQIKYEERLFETFKLILGFNGLDVNSEPLTNFSNNNRLRIEVMYNF